MSQVVEEVEAFPASLAEWIEGDPSQIREIARKHGLLLLVLFGSTVKGTRHAESDLDLAVLFSGPPQTPSWLHEEAMLEGDLWEALQPRCELDLVNLNDAYPHFQKNVAETGIVIYSDVPQRWLLFRIQAYRNFEDTEKYRRRAWERVLAKYGAKANANRA